MAWQALSAALARVGRAAVRGLDALVSRGYGIWEFSDRDDCMLRIAVASGRQDLLLSDGTRVRRGEPVGIIHLWNEHLPPMPSTGPDLAWACRIWRMWRSSMRELAAYAQREPRLVKVRVFGGETAFPSEYARSWRSVLERMGFDVIFREPPCTVWERFAAFWVNGYAWTLVWTYNPGSLRRRDFFRLQRVEMWISRERLLALYAPGR